jgi:preprotein translocase subunit SecA
VVLDKIANLGEGRKRKNLESIAQLVLTYEPEFEDLSDAELFAKTAEFRRRVENGE